jgi:hypothetical protein
MGQVSFHSMQVWNFPSLHIRGHFAPATSTPPVGKHEVN